MKQRKIQTDSTIIAPLLVFTAVAVCVSLVLIFGANIYQRLSQRDMNSYSKRTAVQYLTTRIRQNDAAGSIKIGSFNEVGDGSSGDTLYLLEQIEGELYYTRIYCCEGKLYELFCHSEIAFEPHDGESILEIRELMFTKNDNFLQIRLVFPDGTDDTVLIGLHSKEDQS